MVLMWKQTKNFVTAVLWEKHGQNFRTWTSQPNIVGELVNTDECGPETETSVSGTHYYTCFRNDYSKYRRLVFTLKSEGAVCLRKFLQEMKPTGHVTKVLLLDDGKEFNCAVVQKVLEEYSIMH
jgi:Integrase core domain.